MTLELVEAKGYDPIREKYGIAEEVVESKEGAEVPLSA
jgi:hypothetical protein